MTQNKQVLDKLLTNNSSSSTGGAGTTENIVDDQNHALITAHRVQSIRYKIYSLVIVAIGIVFFTNYLEPNLKSYKGLKEDLSQIQNQTSFFETRQLKYAKDRSLIEKIDEQESQLLEYFNEGKGLDQLDQSIQEEISVVKNYLQVNSLQNNKMLVDEKIILANINEYLLRSEEKSKNGEVNEISIGEPELFNDTAIYYLPIEVNISFDDKDGLLSFVNNVENHILPDSKYRILYKINEISYDVVNYDEEQEVDISLSAYYMN